MPAGAGIDLGVGMLAGAGTLVGAGMLALAGVADFGADPFTETDSTTTSMDIHITEDTIIMVTHTTEEEEIPTILLVDE